MKKLCYVLILAIFLSVIPGSLYVAHATNNPTLTIQSVNVDHDSTDNFELSFSLGNAPSLKTVSVTNLTFDSDKLTYVSAVSNVQGSALASILPNGNAVVSMNGNSDLNDTIFTYTFALKPGVALGDIALSCKLIAKEKPVGGTETDISSSFTVVPGIISVVWNNPFSDVEEGNWAYPSVLFANTRGLFDGTSATTFSQNMSMTRAMLVTVLYRLENKPEVTGSCAFSDIKLGSWYSDAVIWANQSRYVNGTSNTTFDPNAPITRQDMVVLLYRYAKAKGYDVANTGSLDGFTDGNKVSGYAKDAILWAVGKGMIQGSNHCVMPLNDASRAEVATILMQFCETFGL